MMEDWNTYMNPSNRPSQSYIYIYIYIYRTELKDKRTELSLCCCYSEFHALCDHQTAEYYSIYRLVI